MIKVNFKKKFVNHLLKNGNKKTCEDIILKSFKIIQKSTNKSSKKIIQLAVINSSPIFRIKMLRNKRNKRKKNLAKEVPTFIARDFERISWSLKYILYFSRKSVLSNFYKKLKNELILTAQNKGEAIKFKNEFQQKAVINERFLLYFRW